MCVGPITSHDMHMVYVCCTSLNDVTHSRCIADLASVSLAHSTSAHHLQLSICIACTCTHVDEQHRHARGHEWKGDVAEQCIHLSCASISPRAAASSSPASQVTHTNAHHTHTTRTHTHTTRTYTHTHTTRTHSNHQVSVARMRVYGHTHRLCSVKWSAGMVSVSMCPLDTRRLDLLPSLSCPLVSPPSPTHVARISCGRGRHTHTSSSSSTTQQQQQQHATLVSRNSRTYHHTNRHGTILCIHGANLTHTCIIRCHISCLTTRSIVVFAR